HTFSEKLADASIHSITGIPIALITLYAVFYLTRFIGEGLQKYLTEPFFFKVWSPLMLKLSSLLGGEGILHNILIGRLRENKIDFKESFGLLTTGLFIEFSAILPYLISFYLIISILEDSGYLPRLAVVMDNIMHRLGLHGMAIIPMMLGFGCNVPGVLATRTMETKRERFIALTLIAISVPCMAKIAMIVGLLGGYGPLGLGIVFGTLFFSAITLGLLLNRFTKGESMEMFLEIPPYRLPFLSAVAKKLGIKIVWFFRDAFLWVLFGVAIANVLMELRIIEFINKPFAPVISGIWGLPKEAVGALLVGLLRKDVALGMLVPLHLTFNQLIVASVVLSMYFPCLATFSIIMKELGLRDMLKIVGVMAISTLLVGGILNLIL
ncbi:ferrous iron transporter B, partial [bacterium]|nr:ferrous iron transporter B [bacterium]